MKGFILFSPLMPSFSFLPSRPHVLSPASHHRIQAASRVTLKRGAVRGVQDLRPDVQQRGGEVGRVPFTWDMHKDGLINASLVLFAKENRVFGSPSCHYAHITP